MINEVSSNHSPTKRLSVCIISGESAAEMPEMTQMTQMAKNDKAQTAQSAEMAHLVDQMTPKSLS